MGALLVASCGSNSSSSPATSTPASLPPTAVDRAFFGVHDSSLDSLRGGTGVGSVRAWDAGVAWNQIETSPGVYNWASLDSIVSAAQADHAQVTMVLALTPSFYAKDPTKPPKDLTAYRNFVTAVMQRYQSFHGRRGIASYQVWNEANVVNSWTGTEQQMAQLTKVAYDVRAKADPGATLVAPPMAVRLPSQLTWLGSFYGQQVAGQPVWHYVDDIALNLYPLDQYNGQPGTPEDSLKLLAQARASLTDDGVPPTLPIWNTEVNYGLKSGTHKYPHAVPIPAAEQAAYVVRTYLLNAAAGIGRVYWYRWDWDLLDKSIGGGTLGNTLLSKPGDPSVPTEAGKAIAVVAHWLTDDSAQPPQCAQDSHGTWTCRIRHAGGTRSVYWNPTTQAQVTLPAGATTQEDVAGATSQVRAGSSLTVTESPVMVDSSH
jgi:hypothetical protein